MEGIISSRYGKRRFINDLPRSPHLALDIAALSGSKIVAPAKGKIILIGDFFIQEISSLLIMDMGY